VIRYCRAYPVEAFREAPELVPDLVGESTVVYLWDDYALTAEPFVGGRRLVSGEATGWRGFCDDVLGFSVPSHAFDRVAG
jgi:hypothetical protein